MHLGSLNANSPAKEVVDRDLAMCVQLAEGPRRDIRTCSFRLFFPRLEELHALSERVLFAVCDCFVVLQQKPLSASAVDTISGPTRDVFPFRCGLLKSPVFPGNQVYWSGCKSESVLRGSAINDKSFRRYIVQGDT